MKDKSNRSEESKARYLAGYDQISWTNKPRPDYQGGLHPVDVAPLGEIVDAKFIVSSSEVDRHLEASKQSVVKMIGETVSITRGMLGIEKDNGE